VTAPRASVHPHARSRPDRLPVAEMTVRQLEEECLDVREAKFKIENQLGERNDVVNARRQCGPALSAKEWAEHNAWRGRARKALTYNTLRLQELTDELQRRNPVEIAAEAGLESIDATNPAALLRALYGLALRLAGKSPRHLRLRDHALLHACRACLTPAAAPSPIPLTRSVPDAPESAVSPGEAH
jgi:hypothetical protein